MLLRFWTILALLVSVAACLPAAVLYTVTDLGSFGGTYNQATAINNAGQITGYFTTTSGAQHAFLYNNGMVTDLGILPGTTFSGGYGTNDAGQVTGYSGAFTGHDGISRAFLYSNGVLTDLGALGRVYYGEARYSEGRAINNVGQIVGTSGGHAVLYSNGVITDLGTLWNNYDSRYPNGSNGSAINNVGQVTGTSTVSEYASHAFLYSNGVMTDLGTLPGLNYSVGNAINDAGQVTGYCYDASGKFARAFLYSNGVMTDLGTLGGNGSSGGRINNAGQIVGYSSTASGASHAFLYSNGVMADLNDLIDPNLHITLGGAAGINDNGQILAGRYLLTPVPEPGTWLLFGAGLLLVAALARSYR